MATILPSRLEELLTFMENHAGVWQTNAVAIGLTAAQATAFKAAAILARTKYTEQLAAFDAARIATTKQQAHTASAKALAADAIRIIKAFAETQTDPNTVYGLAQIPAPSTPQPAAPPGTPTDFTASLENNGGITLRWKALNPSGQSGTVWTLKRRIGGTGAYTFLGASGRRTFTDNTIPAGSGAVQYIVQGQRADAVGSPSLAFTVQFGVSGAGLTITSQFSEGEEGRMAA